MMNQLVENLLTSISNPYQIPSVAKRITRESPSTSVVLASCEKNKGKVCAVEGCGKPRHVAKSGIARGSKCQQHKSEAQAIAWIKYKKGTP